MDLILPLGPGMTSSAQRGGFGFVERSMVEEETVDTCVDICSHPPQHVDEHFGAFMDKHNKSYEVKHDSVVLCLASPEMVA